MENLYKKCRRSLIGKIKGLAEQIIIVRKFIDDADTHAHKDAHAIDKRDLGIEARHLLLAFAFLRGRTYKSVEAKCRPDNKPNEVLIADLLKHSIPKGWQMYYLSKTSSNAIKKWLEQE